MLYIDQPNQVGFSYDTAQNGTFVHDEEGSYKIIPWDDQSNAPDTNLTSRDGTFASQKPFNTANTTALAAHALWHFAQTWFFEFPNYKPNDDRVSLWAESYGGYVRHCCFDLRYIHCSCPIYLWSKGTKTLRSHYGPGIFDFFLQQNQKITDGTNEEKDAHYIHLDTLGIVNGLIDLVVQGESLITYPYNNVSRFEPFKLMTFADLAANSK